MGTYELRANGSGLPKPYSGGFTTTFHFTTSSGAYAVRCFTRGNDDLERRYQAISEFLGYVQNRSFCQASYLPQGIRVEGSWWPIIKMQWISGKQLNGEVEARLGDKVGLVALAEKFREMARALGVLGVAHGDLQHGNIIVANGDLRLIDYDGIFLPALFGMQASEYGHQNYQHPNRKSAPFDGRLDRFSSIVIYSALIAVSEDPTLWQRFNNDENLLFRSNDFTTGGSSDLFRTLLSKPITAHLARGLIAACECPVEQVPTLEQIINGTVPAVTRPATAPNAGSPANSPPPPGTQQSYSRPPQSPPQAKVWAPARPIPQPPPVQTPPISPLQMQYQATPHQGVPAENSARKPWQIGLAILAICFIANLMFQAARTRPTAQDASASQQSSNPQSGSGGIPQATTAPVIASGSCAAPNAADIRGMQTAITEFHRNVVLHKWESAAYYENTDKFQDLATLERGYTNTIESTPQITGENGCEILITLRFQDAGGPEYCIDDQYTMEYARGPEPRWIIEDSKSLSSPQSCT